MHQKGGWFGKTEKWAEGPTERISGRSAIFALGECDESLQLIVGPNHTTNIAVNSKNQNNKICW